MWELDPRGLAECHLTAVEVAPPMVEAEACPPTVAVAAALLMAEAAVDHLIAAAAHPMAEAEACLPMAVAADRLIWVGRVVHLQVILAQEECLLMEVVLVGVCHPTAEALVGQCLQWRVAEEQRSSRLTWIRAR